MKAKLILTSKDKLTAQDVPFDRPSITIGRKPSNDLSFNRPEISGSHAAFLFENGQYFVMDLGSTNGTLLNGAQLVAKEKYGLQDKDVVTVAPYNIQFQMEDDSMDTMIEVSAQPAAQKKIRSGTDPDFSVSPPVITGAEESAKQAEAAAVNHSSAPAPPPEPKVEAPPADPDPVPAPAPPAAKPAAPKNVPVMEARKGPSAITDYVWLGIGAILVLAAIGLIVYILVGL